VTIFDRNELPGGLDTLGIAAYKLRAKDSLREVEMIRDLGVEFRQKVVVGKDKAFSDIEKEFDAIFVGVGLGETWDLEIPGNELAGVIGALEFIEATKMRPFGDVPVGRRVACIGAGNTAIDVVTAAKRLGAEEVHLIYRRGESDMPAFRYEYDLAKLDGVTFHWHSQPMRIVGVDGKVAALECLRTRPDSANRGGKNVMPIPGSEFRIVVDMVVSAIGQKPVTELLKNVAGMQFRENGTIQVSDVHQTGNPKYFAGGDCVNGGKEVVDAVAEGMAAAVGIDAWCSPKS
jgi:glutamate synthase (NADPH/NADH) small chain